MSISMVQLLASGLASLNWIPDLLNGGVVRHEGVRIFYNDKGSVESEFYPLYNPVGWFFDVNNALATGMVEGIDDHINLSDSHVNRIELVMVIEDFTASTPPDTSNLKEVGKFHFNMMGLPPHRNWSIRIPSVRDDLVIGKNGINIDEPEVQALIREYTGEGLPNRTFAVKHGGLPRVATQFAKAYRRTYESKNTS